jgi:hypothetical protein
MPLWKLFSKSMLSLVLFFSLFVFGLSYNVTFANSSLHPEDNLSYEPDQCDERYMWCEIFPVVHVCVTPGTRFGAARDNSQAPT